MENSVVYLLLSINRSFELRYCQVLIDKCLMIFVVTVFPIAVIVPIAIAVSIYACVFPIL